MKRRRNINSWRLGICRFNVVWNATIDWISVSADIALKILGWLTVYNGRIRLSHKNFGGGVAHGIKFRPRRRVAAAQWSTLISQSYP